MAKKEREEEDPPGAPDWIVTFADMTSLLVTFFVMLLSFSTTDELEMMMISGIKLIGRGGVADPAAGPTPYKPTKMDMHSAVNPRDGASIPHSRPEWELEESLEESGQKEDPEHLAMDLRHIADGMQISFADEASFQPGSAQVSDELARSLIEIGEVLGHYGHLVIVEGFTDDRFQVTPTYPSAEALGLARASAAAHVLLAGGGLRPARVQVAGIGARRFLAANDTARNRSRNRRVEIRVIAVARHDPRRGDSPTDPSSIR